MVTTLHEHAVWLHELYTSLLEAGFEDDVALTMVSDRLPHFPGTEDDED